MVIKRNLERAIRDYLLSDQPHLNTLLLSGARQVGKSTLIQNIIKDIGHVYANLYEMPTLSAMIDATETFEGFERLLRRELNFVPSEGTTLVIDEAQESKRIGRWIHFFKEKWTGQKVIVLGSILSRLFEEDVAYPVGRVEEAVLRPFSFKEFLIATERAELKKILEEACFEKPLSEADRQSFINPYLSYLQTGGMPEIVLSHYQRNESINALIDRLLGQYAMDVERYMDEIYKALFISAIDRIADITCYPIKNSQIISTSSPSYRKLPRLLEVAEKWHLVHKIAAQTKHPESAGGISSKRYLFDVGFTNFFINHSMPVEWQERSEIGNIVSPKLTENFVCNEIISLRPQPTTILNYYREGRNSREIDFILPLKKNSVPIEVKSSSSISRNGLLPMISYLEQRDLKECVLIYTGEMKTIKIRGKKIHAIPPYFISELPRVFGG